MVRARLATLTLAGGLVLTSSGCGSMMDRFQCWRINFASRISSTDCPCQEASLTYGAVHTGIESAGPVLISPEATIQTQPPINQQPQIGPPPRIVPVPANSVPWQGTSTRR